MRQERQRELQNFRKDIFLSNDDSRYRIDGTLQNIDQNVDNTINSSLPPKASTTTQKSRPVSIITLTPSLSGQDTHYNTEERIKGLNKKDLSTISERTERSSSATFLESRDKVAAAIQHQQQQLLQQQKLYNGISNSLKTNQNQSNNTANNGSYKTEAIIIKPLIEIDNKVAAGGDTRQIVPNLGKINTLFSYLASSISN